jgi:benzoate membrane transport protein
MQVEREKPNVGQNLRNLFSSLVPSTWIAGLLIVIIGFAGSIVLILPAAEAGGLSQAEIGSWVWAVSLSSGLATIVLSLWYGKPVITAWSTPGLVLLGSSLAYYSLAEAVGVYIVVSALIMVLGFSGLFEKVVALIPQPVAMAVLGGLLLKYGVALFTGLKSDPIIVLAVMAVFLFLRRIKMRVPIAGALLVGFAAAFLMGKLDLGGVRLELAAPVLIWPQFTLSSLLGLGLPLLVLALASQDLPGFVVMRAAGYEPPVNGSLVITGLVSLLFAPMLNHGTTMAAITAAIGNAPEAHPDPKRRYAAGVATGTIKIIFGIFGVTIVTLLTALPPAVIAAIAGLALSGTILQCLIGGFQEPAHRDASLWALLITASDVQIFGIGSAFWGFVVGVLVHMILTGGQKAPLEATAKA